MTGERIIVGIDGSSGSRRALEWAMGHAGPSDRIEVIHTWNVPVTASEVAFGIDPTIFEQSAEIVLGEEIERLRSQHGDLENLTGHIARGHPGAALIEAAKDADLLVVGTRGHGGFAGLLLGSTSSYLAHHASCPLVIVPGGPDNDAD